MAGGISFDFLTNLSRFLPGTRQVKVELQDIRDDLRGMGTDADAAQRDMSTAFDRAQRDASGLGGRIREGGRFKEAGAEAGGEFMQNMGESFSSGDYSNMAADVAGGLMSSISAGPGLILAGGATIVALLVRGMQERADQIKAVGQTMAEAYVSAFEAGIKAHDLTTITADALKQTLTDMGQTMGGAQSQVEGLGIAWDDWIKAMAVGGSTLDTVRRKLETEAAETRTARGAHGRLITGYTDRARAAQNVLAVMDRMHDATGHAISDAQAEADARDGARHKLDHYKRSLDAATAAADADSEATRRLAHWLKQLPDKKRIEVEMHMTQQTLDLMFGSPAQQLAAALGLANGPKRRAHAR